MSLNAGTVLSYIILIQIPLKVVFRNLHRQLLIPYHNHLTHVNYMSTRMFQAVGFHNHGTINRSAGFPEQICAAGCIRKPQIYLVKNNLVENLFLRMNR